MRSVLPGASKSRRSRRKKKVYIQLLTRLPNKQLESDACQACASQPKRNVDNRKAGVALVATLHKVETDLALSDRFVLELIQQEDWSFERTQ